VASVPMYSRDPVEGIPSAHDPERVLPHELSPKKPFHPPIWRLIERLL